MSAAPADLAQRAASDGASSVWVAASAGTGKTKVLTDRVLALMLVGNDPARILCLTFTRAAAAEMANRLNERLAAWAVAQDGTLAQDLQGLLGRMPDEALCGRARRLFARVLDAPGRMKIETIHAFCQSLLRRFPIEAEIPPHFEVMDEKNAGEALVEARDRMLVEARAGADPALALALEIVAEAAGEATFDERMKTLIVERARLEKALGDGLEAFRSRLCAALGVAEDATPETIVAAACAAVPPGLAAAAALMSASGSLPEQGRGAVLAAFLAATPAARPELFDDYCDVFVTKTEGTERKTLLTKKLSQAAPQIEAALRAEAQRIIAALAAREAAALLQATHALATLGTRMLALYRRHKEQRALLDYDDLVLKSRDLLCGPGVPPWVLFKLDGGIDHILIDEAQDTNPEQWEVVAKLADEFFVGRGAREGKRTVFAVGDAKQSIFSFQRADPSAFARMHDHFKRRVDEARESWRKVDLDISFRSTEPVLAAVDAVFAREDARRGVADTVRHVASRAGAAGLVELWPAVVPLEAPPAAPWELPVEQRRASDAQLRLAQAIAATIHGWIAGGERLEARDRRIVAGDVMVLVRRRTAFVPALVRALKELNVAVAGADRMRLVEQLAVEDMMALLRFVLLPEDDLNLATVLKGPLLGFDEEALYAVAYDRGERVSLWSALRRRAGADEQCRYAAALLDDLLRRADFAPPYELLAEILGERRGRRKFLARLGPDAADPLDELLAASLTYERRHGPSIQGFLHWLEAGDFEVKRDFDQRGRDEVRIMTVHGAKGLQAPIVFLPDTLQVPNQPLRFVWSEDGLPLWAADDECAAPAHDRARTLAKERRAEEYRRLLYVAMTRAEDRLYVCGWKGAKPPPDGNWYALIEAGLRAAPGVESFPFAARIADGWSGDRLRLAAPQRVPIKSDASAPESTAAPSLVALPSWARVRPRPDPIPPRPLAPSQPEGAAPAPRSPLGQDQGVSFRRGLIVHRLLQSLPQLEPLARAAAARRFLALPVHGLGTEAQEALLAETLAVLDHPDLAPLFGPQSLAEVAVVGLSEGRALSGRIDRLAVHDGTVLIVDYKTLRPVPPSEDEIPPVYMAQLKAYRAAVARVYPGHAIRCGLLWTDGPQLMWVSDRRLH